MNSTTLESSPGGALLARETLDSALRPATRSLPARRPAGDTSVAYWLFKSEPSSWSWDQQVAAGAGGTPWTGVRNHLAKKHLQAMRTGERGFFYHSNEGKSCVGIVEVIREYHPDDTDPTGRFGMVDVKAVEPLSRPVTLDEIKRVPDLADMALIRNARLSVQPVTDAEWRIVRGLGGL